MNELDEFKRKVSGTQQLWWNKEEILKLNKKVDEEEEKNNTFKEEVNTNISEYKKATNTDINNFKNNVNNDISDYKTKIDNNVNEIKVVADTANKKSDQAVDIAKNFASGLFDSELNSVSENAPQNKVVTTKLESLENRVNNLIAGGGVGGGSSTEGNAELLDIRAGYDNSSFETAGESVRSQTENLKDLTLENEPLYIHELFKDENYIAGTYYNHGAISYGEQGTFGRYKPIKVFYGLEYHLKYAALYFSNIKYDDGQVLPLSNNASPTTTPEYIFKPQKNGELYITVSTAVHNNRSNQLSNGKPLWDTYDENNYYLQPEINKSYTEKIHEKAYYNAFANVTKELLKETNKIENCYYPHNTSLIPASADGYICYKPIKVDPNFTYQLKLVIGYFSPIKYEDGTIEFISDTSSPMTNNYTFKPKKAGDLYITITKNVYNNKQFSVANGDLTNTMYNENIQELNYLINQDNIIQNEIHVGKSGYQYNTLTAAVNSVGENETVVIYIHSGVYDLLGELGGDSFLNSITDSSHNRQGLTLKGNISIIGIGNVIINLLIDDSKANKNICEKVSAFECYGNYLLQNLTINVKNCRYAIHDETGNNEKYNYTSHMIYQCAISHLGNVNGYWAATAAYAAGTSGGCLYEMIDTKFVSYQYLAFSIHNNANQDKIVIKFNGVECYGDYGAYSCKFAYYLNNTTKSDIYLKNCLSNLKFVIRPEIMNVESDNIYQLHNFSNVTVDVI